MQMSRHVELELPYIDEVSPNGPAVYTNLLY